MEKLLSRWYTKSCRSLPWRKTSDPYSIWISETMLQQTQAKTVIPYYENFLRLFPNLEALANAPEEKVLTAWSGLGYYSRARNLKKGAQYIRGLGEFPKTREELLEVPGIGPYTAGAVLSIAFDLPVPLVDGNVQRVFSRYFGYRKPIDESPAQKFFWEQAEISVKRSESPRVFNQSLMELGATVCTKAAPRCGICPISKTCVSFAKGWQSVIPVKKKKTKYVDQVWMALVVKKGKQVLMRKNSQGEWWQDLWDFPRRRLESINQLEKEISAIENEFDIEALRPLNHQKHTVTKHRLTFVPYQVMLKKTPRSRLDGKWVAWEKVPELPLSSLARKIFSSLELKVK